MRRSTFPFFITAFVLIFMYLPIVILVTQSFNAARFGGEWAGFSLNWYRQLYLDGEIWNAMMNTLLISVSATLISTVLGTMAAYAIHKWKNKWQLLHYGLLYSPLVVPEILMGLSLLLLFISMGISLGIVTIIIAHATFCMSYVAMVVLARFENFDPSLIEASHDLGANRWETTIKVVIPQLLPGIISGALLSFTMSIDDYVITSFVAGPGATTVPLKIFGLIKHGTSPVINALSTIIIAVSFVIVYMTHNLAKESVT